MEEISINFPKMIWEDIWEVLEDESVRCKINGWKIHAELYKKYADEIWEYIKNE